VEDGQSIEILRLYVNGKTISRFAGWADDHNFTWWWQFTTFGWKARKPDIKGN